MRVIFWAGSVKFPHVNEALCISDPKEAGGASNIGDWQIIIRNEAHGAGSRRRPLVAWKAPSVRSLRPAQRCDGTAMAGDGLFGVAGQGASAGNQAARRFRPSEGIDDRQAIQPIFSSRHQESG